MRNVLVLPVGTSTFKNEKCSGQKKIKERLIVLLAVNIDSSEELTSLIIVNFTNLFFHFFTEKLCLHATMWGEKTR